MRRFALALYVCLLVSLVNLAGFAQDSPIGDVARAARAQRSQAPHANKVVTDEDIGPQVGPLSETDDPDEVVNKAAVALKADTQHTCRNELSNNSGPGYYTETIREVAGPDRAHLVINRTRVEPAHSELIVIGQDIYSRSGAGPWVKTAGSSVMPPTPLPEALWNHYSGGEIRLTGRNVIAGTIVFVYETKYHPGGVSGRDRAIEFWIGIKDGLLRRVQMVDSEASSRVTAPTVQRDVTTCSYGQVAEIKPPM
ncbi:exported hypothetical protein [Candidatus Sulfotelmatobacter kueseliae]|uniref:Lipoprotein n=1 Tax=Candidatus Sulfotelmatobacter kueseliae TaxID=2042962 RepID=A0A2U3L674_9BACT|nr:exported hypothetical protein [Candidatus Sulfotelmatobacter kueseliae]